MKKPYVIFSAVVVLAAAGAGGYRFVTHEKPQTITVKRQDLTVSVKAKAFVEADKTANMAFKVPGRITYVGVKKGDTVTKGKLLASIDATDYQNAYQNSLKDYMTTRWQFEQTRDDYKDTIADDTIRRTKEESQFTLDKSVTNVETALWMYGSTALYAPFDGVVTDVNTETGDLALQTVPTVVVEKLDTLKLTAQVSETGVAGIVPGDSVTLTMDAYDGKTFHGTVTTVDPTATVISGNNLFLTEIRPTDLPKTAKPGMKADVSIVTETKKNVIAVPLYTLQDIKDSSATVQVWRNGTKIAVPVTIGERGDGGMVVVTDGIDAGTEIVSDIGQ